jgi:hypothetical protein
MHLRVDLRPFCCQVRWSLVSFLPTYFTFLMPMKIWEMAKRGGYTLNISGRRELEGKIRQGTGGIWLELSILKMVPRSEAPPL